MSGTLKVGENATWSPAGWVYDGVLELMSHDLAHSHPALSHLIAEAKTDKRGYFDLSGLDAEDFNVVLQAAENALAETASGGPAAFKDPKWYQPFSNHFRALLALLHADARAFTFVSTSPSF